MQHCTVLVRRAAAAAATIGLVIGGVTAPTSAAATKPAGKSAKPTPAVTKFTASGTVSSVGADALTLTLDVKGGNVKLKGQSLTVSVPSTARVTRNGLPATLGDVQAGDHVAVQGVKSGGVSTATKVHVDMPVVVTAV